MRPGDISIEVDFAPTGVSPYAAVVKLAGEHDLATRDELSAALAPLYGDLLLDLTRCEFIDSAVIALVLRKAQQLTRDGHRIELVVAPGSNVERALEIVDIRQFLTIHDHVPADGSASSDRAVGSAEPAEQ
jgi:anti-anti-sigma factor